MERSLKKKLRGNWTNFLPYVKWANQICSLQAKPAVNSTALPIGVSLFLSQLNPADRC